jgi:hypothetical protein
MVSNASLFRVARSDSLLVRVSGGSFSGGVGAIIGFNVFDTPVTQILVAGVLTLLLLMLLGVGYDLVTGSGA